MPPFSMVSSSARRRAGTGKTFDAVLRQNVVTEAEYEDEDAHARRNAILRLALAGVRLPPPPPFVGRPHTAAPPMETAPALVDVSLIAPHPSPRGGRADLDALLEAHTDRCALDAMD